MFLTLDEILADPRHFLLISGNNNLVILVLLSYKYSVSSLSRHLILYSSILTFTEECNVSLYRKFQLVVDSFSLPYLSPVVVETLFYKKESMLSFFFFSIPHPTSLPLPLSNFNKWKIVERK